MRGEGKIPAAYFKGRLVHIEFHPFWDDGICCAYTPVTNIAMKNGPFEDVFPIEHGDIPASYVSLPEGNFPESHFFSLKNSRL